MDCSCNQPQPSCPTPGVIEVEKPIMFRLVKVPSSVGDETAFPPNPGLYRNVLLHYDINEHTYIYSSDGMPVLLTVTAEGGEGTVKSVNSVEPDSAGNVTLSPADIGAPTTEALSAEIAERQEGDTLLQSAIDGKQDALSQAQLAAVNSGIDSTKVGQIASNASDIDTIEGKIPAQATAQNQLADKDFVNSSVATNTANYISNNGEPFTSLAQLEAYSGDLSNNDYAFVVGTDSAGNTTYTRYKYVADTQEWAEEYVLNNSSFTANQWAAINSGITSGDVTKLAGIEAGAEVNEIDSISVNGVAQTPDANKNVDLTIDEGIKTLTIDDYDYPTANPVCIAMWRLEPGLYKIEAPSGSTSIKGQFGSADTSSSRLDLYRNQVILVTRAAGMSDNNLIMFTSSSAAAYKNFLVYRANVNGTSSGATLLSTNTVIDALTSSSALAPLSANQGRVLKDLIDSIAIRGAGAPTTSTVGTVGQLYEDGTNGALYQLKSIDITVTPNTYNWEEVGGGSGPAVVQTTGTSTTDVMSQKAVTGMVFRSDDKNKINIGGSTDSGLRNISIGSGATANGNDAIAIGGANVYNSPATAGYVGGIAIGAGSALAGARGIAIGGNTEPASITRAGASAIALGSGATATGNGSIALGHKSNATSQGQFDVSTGTLTTAGYNNSNYRLLTGLYDGQSEHDAATKGQLDGLITMTDTDPGEGATLAANHFIAYYE